MRAKGREGPNVFGKGRARSDKGGRAGWSGPLASASYNGKGEGKVGTDNAASSAGDEGPVALPSDESMPSSPGVWEPGSPSVVSDFGGFAGAGFAGSGQPGLRDSMNYEDYDESDEERPAPAGASGASSSGLQTSSSVDPEAPPAAASNG